MAKALRGISDYLGNTKWGQTLSQLGSITFGYKTQFFLSRPADPASIKVKVNGQAVAKGTTTGWSYDSSNNSILFSSKSVPGSGALIEVSYKALCLPP